MLQIKRLEGALFYSIIFLITIQLGKHFWPSFSFVNGVRLDYLSPTLYLSDIFILVFIFVRIALSYKEFVKFLSSGYLLPLFLISILVSSVFAQNPQASFYWGFKIIQVVLLAWAVSSMFMSRNRLLRAIDVFIIAGVLQALIGIMQFITQGSLGGLLYFLGERAFNVDTIGIATFYSNGSEILRSYGTFPHPNVLALFLSIGIILAVQNIINVKSQLKVYLYILATSILSLGLLVTASRVTIIITIILLIIILVKKRKHFAYSIIALALIFPIYLLIFSGRFLSAGAILESIFIRVDLFRSGAGILFDNLLFGVGLNNTFYINSANLPNYARFQPVHNIYLHLVLQLGVFGGIVAALFIVKIWKRMLKLIASKKFPLFTFALFGVEILVIGLFDHFLITLQQGLILAAVTVGILLNRTMEQE